MEKEVESVIQDELHPTVEIMTMGEVIYQLNQLTVHKEGHSENLKKLVPNLYDKKNYICH
jgi:hypothetical protein